VTWVPAGPDIFRIAAPFAIFEVEVAFDGGQHAGRQLENLSGGRKWTSCRLQGTAPPVPGSRAKHFSDLVNVACQQISSQFTAIPAKDRSGKQVRSVQSASVLFSLSD